MLTRLFSASPMTPEASDTIVGAGAQAIAVEALSRALCARDPYTGGHLSRVRDYSVQIAGSMGLTGAMLRHVACGATLHDVGKIGVPDSILGKRGPLDLAEMQLMRRHPEIGVQLLQGMDYLGPALDGVAFHHERWDGAGYPYRLGGQEIPLIGRIIAVADAYDAVTSHRPYRRGLSAKAAMARILDDSGKQFDPDVMDAFMERFARDADIAAVA